MLPPASMLAQFIIDMSLFYHKPISLNMLNSTTDSVIDRTSDIIQIANAKGITVVTEPNPSSNLKTLDVFLCDREGEEEGLCLPSVVKFNRDNVYLIHRNLGDFRPNLDQEVFLYSMSEDFITLWEVYFIKGIQGVTIMMVYF